MVQGVGVGTVMYDGVSGYGGGMISPYLMGMGMGMGGRGYGNIRKKYLVKDFITLIN